MVHQLGAAPGVILAVIIAACQAHSAFTVTGTITDTVNSFAVLVVLKTIELGLL